MAIKQSARQGRILVRTELRIAGSMDMHNNKTISRYPSGKSVFRSVIRNIDIRHVPQYARKTPPASERNTYRSSGREREREREEVNGADTRCGL
jgi:hypothetical protein